MDSKISGKNLSVIGTFEGECADSNITNKNGLDITKEVWDTVFNSDEYKQSIELGWYIGYLGHPEDPSCMDFEHACIVMTDGRVEDSGKIYGKFNLIDTPVGRIVKSFIDSGVTFGISVRGAGDIVDNSVDPDTFIFRGFDLVTFPAYPEAIPTFQEIAASSDPSKQKKYEAVCSAVKDNIDSLNTREAIDIVQSQFARQSDEYKMLENKKSEMEDSVQEIDLDDLDPIMDKEVYEEKLEGVMKLYLNAKSENSELCKENELLKSQIKLLQSTNYRKLNSVRRVMSSQIQDLKSDLNKVTASRDTLSSCNGKLKDEYQSILASEDKMREDMESLRDSNLKYRCKVEASEDAIKSKDHIISRLESELDETVKKSSEFESRVSNLDAKVRKLRDDIRASQELVEEYQDAYANLYANAIGITADKITISSSTNVKELQSILGSSSRLSSSTEPTPVEILDDTDDMVTL